MSRILAAVAAALMIFAMQSATVGAPKKEQKRAYKPAQQREEADAQPAQAKDGDAPAAAGTFEEELKAAKEKRDKDLEDAAAEGADRRTLEQRKEKIFAQYAAIVAALRDKYEAAHPDDATTRYNTKNRGKTKSTRAKPPADDDATPDTPKSRQKNKKNKDGDSDALAEAQEKLDEENARHQAKMDQLNGQLAEAKASDNQRQVRNAQKQIEKENNTYSSRKSILERKVQDLGGTAPAVEPPSAAAPGAVSPGN